MSGGSDAATGMRRAVAILILPAPTRAPAVIRKGIAGIGSSTWSINTFQKRTETP